MSKGKYTLSKKDLKRMLKDVETSKPVGKPKRSNYE